MPSYKPRVQVLLDTEFYEKYKFICKKERRTESVMGAIMIEKYISEYEQQNGEIPVKTSKDIYEEEINMIKNQNERNKILKSLKKGLEYGDKSAKEILQGNLNPEEEGDSATT